MPQKIPPCPGLCGPFGHVKGSIYFIFETRMSLDINIFDEIFEIFDVTPPKLQFDMQSVEPAMTHLTLVPLLVYPSFSEEYG